MSTKQLIILIAVILSTTFLIFFMLLLTGILGILSRRVYKRMKIAIAVFTNKKLRNSMLRQQLWLKELDTLSDASSALMMQMAEKLGPNLMLIPAKHIKIREKIGSGTFGDVYSAVLRGSTEVAVKTIRGTTIFNKGSNTDNDKTTAFVHEITLWS